MIKNERLWTADFIAVCLCSFFLFMVFYMFAVTLPVVVTDNLGIGQGQVGLLTAVFMLMAMVFRPVAGKWSDERNRKVILYISLILFISSTAAFLIFHHYYGLLLLRVLQGMGFGTASVIIGAFAFEQAPHSRKGEAIGYFSLAMSIATVLGPFLGLVLVDHYSDTIVFGVCTMFAVLALVCAAVVQLPAPLGPAKPQPDVRNWKKYMESGAIPISVVGLLLACSHGTVTTFVSVFTSEIGLGQATTYYFMVNALVIIISRPFTGRLYDRFGSHWLIYPGIILFGAGIISLSQVHTAAGLLLAGGVIGLGFGALLPSFQTIAIQMSPSYRRGSALGTYWMFFDFGYGAGSFVLGIVASATDYRTMFVVNGIVALSLAVAYFLFHHRLNHYINLRYTNK